MFPFQILIKIKFMLQTLNNVLCLVELMDNCVSVQDLFSEYFWPCNLNSQLGPCPLSCGRMLEHPCSGLTVAMKPQWSRLWTANDYFPEPGRVLLLHRCCAGAVSRICKCCYICGRRLCFMDCAISGLSQLWQHSWV